MAWCRQATSHYLSQCCPRSMSPYGVIRPQWVKTVFPGIGISIIKIRQSCHWGTMFWSFSTITSHLTDISIMFVSTFIWFTVTKFCRFSYKQKLTPKKDNTILHHHKNMAAQNVSADGQVTQGAKTSERFGTDLVLHEIPSSCHTDNISVALTPTTMLPINQPWGKVLFMYNNATPPRWQMPTHSTIGNKKTNTISQSLCKAFMAGICLLSGLYKGTVSIPVKLPWIFLGGPLETNGAPGNIQGNLTGMCQQPLKNGGNPQ